MSDLNQPVLEQTLEEVVAVADDIAMAVSTPSTVERLGTGEWATAYGLGDFAIKMFRQRGDYQVDSVMCQEIAIHRRLDTDPENPLPALHAYRILEPEFRQENRAVGYLIYDRIPGKTLQFRDLLEFEPRLLKQWMRKLAKVELRLERALARVEPLDSWGKPGQETFVDDWVHRINQRTKEMREISQTYAEDRKLAADVARSFRNRVTEPPILIHGSMQPDNTLTQFGEDANGRQTVDDVRLIDPLICRAVWTQNARWLSLYPGMAEAYADAYAMEAGVGVDRISLSAYAVLTHLHNALKYENPRGSIYRPHDAALCREALGRWVEIWKQAVS